MGESRRTKSDPHESLRLILGENAPKKWEKLGDLVLFPRGSVLPNGESLLKKIAEVLRVKRLGIQGEIDSGMMRKSTAELILGKDGWVEHRENGIIFGFDATKVMFSSGNVSERMRISGIDMEGEIVVDAYSGIGYYTLPILVHSKAKHVYSCEINPDSITALKWNLEKNQVADRCTIMEGDNAARMKELKGLADRVHLGLIPSSELSWKNSINCLKESGGVIHVHMNHNSKKIELDKWVEELAENFREISGKQCTVDKVTKVKWYAPHIRHVVVDIRVD